MDKGLAAYLMPKRCSSSGGLTLKATGTQQALRSGILMLRVRDEQLVKQHVAS